MVWLLCSTTKHRHQILDNGVVILRGVVKVYMDLISFWVPGIKFVGSDTSFTPLCFNVRNMGHYHTSGRDCGVGDYLVVQDRPNTNKVIVKLELCTKKYYATEKG